MVCQTGGLLLMETLGATGLNKGLAQALARWRPPRAVHDPGKIVTDLAMALALGADRLADISMLRDSPELTEDIQAAIVAFPEDRWEIAYDADRQPRHGAWVAEPTGLLDLTSWPKGMRVIVRKERPHPGAQLRFTDLDGHRFTCFVTGTRPGGGRGPARRYEPKRLRLRLFAVAGRMTHGGRRLRPRIAARWPWAQQINCRLRPRRWCTSFRCPDRTSTDRRRRAYERKDRLLAQLHLTVLLGARKPRANRFTERPAISPFRVLPRQAQHQVPDLSAPPRAADLAWIHPQASGQAAVPGRRGARPHRPMSPQAVRQESHRRG
ncbi:hypothetical protein GCM10017673_12420 [Streptosporangium violaceochromogenes]|nr:hypothetical protein GCM10017673_12420 [Streptosporangium violaceochromogenes]